MDATSIMEFVKEPDDRFESLARSDDVMRALADLPEGPRQVF